jgi:hypothetical protein
LSLLLQAEITQFGPIDKANLSLSLCGQQHNIDRIYRAHTPQITTEGWLCKAHWNCCLCPKREARSSYKAQLNTLHPQMEADSSSRNVVFLTKDKAMGNVQKYELCQYIAVTILYMSFTEKD